MPTRSQDIAAGVRGQSCWWVNREDPRAGGQRQEWTQLGLHLGRRRSSGLRSSLAADTVPPFPLCRQHPHLHLRPPSCPEPDPCPSLGSAAFEVLSLCRAEAALGQGQKGEAPFPFTHFAQRLPLPRLYMPPGSWLLVTALHRHCLFFCLCVTFPTASRGPLCPLLPLPLLSGLILCLSYSLSYFRRRVSLSL